MTEPDEPKTSGTVVDLDHIRVLAAGVPRPELGQRLPQPQIQRWNRAGNTDLLIGDVTSILREGEQGRTRRLVDLWLRMLKTDSHLNSVWMSRISPVASARWELSPGEGPEATAPMAQRLRDACEEALRGLGNLEPVFTKQLGALGPGYSVAEIVWGRGRLLGRPGWVPIKVKPAHARRFQFSDDFELGLYDEGTGVTRLREAGYEPTVIVGRGGLLARLPAGKFIVHQPSTIDDYPTATGLVHPVARWWWAKQIIIRYWLGGAEVAANPRLIGEILQNAPGTAAQDLLDGLEALAADGVAIAREGTKITVIPGQGQSASAVWQDAAKFMDAAMSKVVLGSTLNVEIGDTGGNRAAAESQDSATIEPRQEQDGSQLWSTWREHLFRFVREFNPHLFGSDTPLPMGKFIFAEDPVQVDDLIVNKGGVTWDEFRVSRGLPEWGGEMGAQRVPAQEAARPFSAPSQEPAPMSDTPAEVGADPFSLARARGRAHLPSTGATQTSLPWLTTNAPRPSGS